MSTHYFQNLSRHIENWRHDSDRRATNLCRTQKLKQLFEKILGKLMRPPSERQIEWILPKDSDPPFQHHVAFFYALLIGHERAYH
jgi:hypothetical protein